MPKIFNKKSKAFTLIELLVVIAIIGLLSSIVLVSLRGAKARAQDARIIADMGQLRSTAEIFAGNYNGYTGFCTDPDVTNLKNDINSQGGRNYFCESDASAYCIEVQLNNNQWWCVDSALRSKQYATNPACSSTSKKCE